jgi:arylsulfatase A-like enzyme
VPLLVRYPQRFGARGRVERRPVNLPDVMPTLLALAGLPAVEGVQGVNLFGRARPAPALLNLAVPFTEARRYGFAEYRGLRTARHTFVRSIHGPWLLYDNHADPWQKHNLCGRAEARTVQAALERALDARLKQLGDDFLPGARYVERIGAGHYHELATPVHATRSPWGDWESTLRQ